MRFLSLLPLLLLAAPVWGQVNPESIPLTARYLLLKTQSETYNDYKVIKEFQLDRFWAITRDTLNADKSVLAERSRELVAMKAEADRLRLALEQKEIAQADLVFDSTHIRVFGIAMGKRSFLLGVMVTIIALVFGLTVVSGRMRLLVMAVQEKMELANLTLRELEDFKRKSLEKQIKLSRELQNERNKLVELRRS
ncbi:MAG TPA: hypothetical protein PLX35_07725 [Cyclobacteriaceae bacterium]|nr:hypothetical protein [Cyclobacteriaceae bacterium]